VRLCIARFITSVCAFSLLPLGAPAQTAPATAGAAASPAVVTGVITDSAGHPQGDVTVRITGASTQSLTTDANGAYSATLAPGLYDIVFSKSGFASADTGDLVIIAGERRTLGLSLSDLTLTSLRTISRTTTRGIRPGVNTSTAGVSVLPSHVLTDRETPDLALLGTELPGITQQRGGSSPNSNFVIRGALQEANAAVDGHIIRAGNFGALLTTYIPAQTFGSLEVTKGPGQFGPTAGDSVFGTINFRTPDFAPGNFGDVTEGIEATLNAPYSTYLFNGNFLPKDRLSLVAQYVTVGTKRPGDGTPGFKATNNLGTPLIAFGTDFSSEILQRSEVLKARYKISDATSLSVGFIGVQGTVIPQGGAYASNLGTATLYPCTVNTGTANVPGVLFAGSDPSGSTTTPLCDQNSAYGNPRYASQQNNFQPTTLFNSLNPSSLILDNEPQFEAEFRTTIGKDTLLVRPAFTLINRTIDGALESNVAGLSSPGGNTFGFGSVPNAPKGVASGNFYQVTAPGHCGTQFAYPNPAVAGPNGSAFGPCFQGTNAAPFTTASNPCSPATPCYAPITVTDAAGRTRFSTPFNQTQVDRDRDFQVLYNKVFGKNQENSVNFGYDYNSDDNSNISGDPSGFLLPVSPTALVANPFTTQTVGNVSTSYPPSRLHRNDFSISAVFQPRENLQVQVGDNFTQANLSFGVVDPNLVAGAQALVIPSTGPCPFANGYANPVPLAAGTTVAPCAGDSFVNHISAQSGYVQRAIVVHHNDPQIGVAYRITHDIQLRASGGSSTFVPYSGLVGGKPNLNTQTTATNPYVSESFPNANLVPETTVAYDLGGDIRLPSTILSLDLFDNTIHNKLVPNNRLVTQANAPFPISITNSLGGMVNVNQTINAPLERTYGLEFSFDGTQTHGFGYRFTGTFQRDYYDQIANSFYAVAQSNLINGQQIPNDAPFSQLYGELNYHDLRGLVFLAGLQYYGSNNQTLGPAYTDTLVSARTPLVAGRVYLQGTVDNLFNTGGTQYGGALQGAGFATLRYGAASPGAPLTYTSSPSNFQFIQPRTFRIQLSTHVGTGAGSSSITAQQLNNGSGSNTLENGGANAANGGAQGPKK